MNHKYVLLTIIVLVVLLISGCGLRNDAERLIDNKTDCIYDSANLEQYIFHIDKFGLNSSDYTLNCMNANFTRGGFIEVQGVYRDGSNFELLDRWGWCSSGGADCGWTRCLAVEGNDELFNTVKNQLCSELVYIQTKDDQMCRNENYTNFDKTQEAIQECLNGKYDYANGNKKTISLSLKSSRCYTYVQNESPDCLNIY